MILGLNLLNLLAQNKLDEFHTEIELLTQEQLGITFINYPLQLEQFVTEGSYNKMFQAIKHCPSIYYSFFLEQLLLTVRESIAACFAKSYKHLETSEAQKMLGFADFNEMNQFALKVKLQFLF